jgi:hypothetical protein
MANGRLDRAFLAGVAWLSLYGLVAALRGFATFSIGY